MSALTSLLARDQVVPVRKIEEALQKQVVSGGEMSSVLLELDAIPENTLAAYCAALYGLLPATRDEVMRVPRDTVRIVPREIAERHRLVPIAVDGGTLLVAMARPLAPEVEEQLGFLLGFEIVTRVVCEVRISAALLHHYTIEAAPRLTRLIDKLRQREPGPVPYVAPPQESKLDRASLTELPAKRKSVADWLDDDDDDDEDEAEAAPPSPPAPRPSQVPEGRATDPLGVTREAVERHVEERRAREESRRPSSLPPPQPVGETRSAPVVAPEPVAREIEPPRESAVPQPAPASEEPPRSDPGSETARALRRLRGPLTASQAVKLLEQAGHRDEILEVFFAFARQFFDYAALFVVHDDVADGRDAFGSGASAPAVQRMAVPLEVPGTFGSVRRSLAPHVGRLESSELDRLVLRDLGRRADATALVMPVAIRGRAVLLFYADRDADAFELSDLPELVAFVPRVVDAFERLILRRKRGAGARGGEKGSGEAASGDDPGASRGDASQGGGSRAGAGFSRSDAADPDAPSTRDALKGAARALALSAQPSRPRASWTPAEASQSPSTTERGLPRASELPRGAVPAFVAANGRDATPTSDLTASMWETSPAPQPQSAAEAASRRRSSSSSLEAAGVLAAESARAPAQRPRAPSAPAIDVAALARAQEPPRPARLRSVLGIPRAAPLPPDADVALPPVSERPPASDDDEPELTLAYDEAPVDLSSGEVDLDDRLTDPDVEPSGASAPAAASRRPGGGGAYLVHDVAVDVVETPRRRASVAAPASERPRAHSSRPDPRAEDPELDQPVTQEIVHVPAIEARRHRTESGPPQSRAAPPSSEESPSVIVDMGDQVNALVVDLSRCGPDNEQAFVDTLLRMGEVALPTLAQAFPGPLWFNRRRPYRRLPRGRDVSAIARALVAFRERAAPYVATLLDAGQADRRFYATMVAGELVHHGLTAALAERVFDDDEGIRAAVLEILPRFRVFTAEWVEMLAQMRRAAKIRGRDPEKRRRAARALGALRDAGSARLLIELLDDEDHDLGEVAHRALVEIACEDMGSAARRWMPWLQKNERRHRIEWLIDALSHSDEAIRTSAGEELKALTQQYYGFHPAASRKEREVAQQKYRKWWEDEGHRLFGA